MNVIVFIYLNTSANKTDITYLDQKWSGHRKYEM